MEIQFQNTQRDLRTAFRQLPWAIRFSPELVILAAALPAVGGLYYFGHRLTILFFLLFVVCFNVLVRRIQSPLKNLDPQLLLPISLRLEPQRIESQSESQSTYRPWHRIASIRETRQAVLIFVRRAIFIPIPRRAFKDDEHCSRFVKLASQYLAGAAATPAKPNNIDLPIIGDSKTVRFSAAVSSLTALLKSATQKPPQKSKMGSLVVWIVALAVISLFLMRDSVLGSFSVFVFAAAVFFVMLVVISKIYQRVLNGDQMLKQELELTVSEPGLFHGSTDVNFLTRWNAIREVKRTNDVVAFLSAPNVAVSGAPLSAFESAEECAAFVELAQRYLRDDQGLNQPVIDAAAVEESGNPYQPPIT